MQNFFTIASAEPDMMKFVFFGILFFLLFIGNILKKLGFNDENGDAKANKGRQPNFGGNAKQSRIDDDMAKARRRLQEMVREREAQRGFFEPSYNDEPFGGEAQESYEPKLELEPEPEFVNTLPRQTERNEATMQSERNEATASDNVYAQNNFDYNMQLEASQKLLAESEIAYNKVVPKTDTFQNGVVEQSIKATEIKDFVHNKTLLKKSIIISEILAKPLSLR